MKQHTTNYTSTLITPAEDCPVQEGMVPPLRGAKKSIANYQYDYLSASPYHYQSDELLFLIHALRKAIPEAEQEAAKTAFFAKPQACLRTSPLAKRYGWGIHHQGDGTIALVGSETPAYQRFLADDTVQKVAAMRSSKR